MRITLLTLAALALTGCIVPPAPGHTNCTTGYKSVHCWFKDYDGRNYYSRIPMP